MKKTARILIGLIIIGLVIALAIYNRQSKYNSTKCTQAEENNALDNFLTVHPEYQPANDPKNVRWSLFKSIYKTYGLTEGVCPQKLTDILEKTDAELKSKLVSQPDLLFQQEDQSIKENTQASTTSASSSELYNLSTEDRDYFLFTANQNKEYQVVVNATDDGIQNHRDLVWEDIDFWNHRGFALYSLGDCNEAGAAFYHVLMRAPKDDLASGLMDSILNKQCGTATSTKLSDVTNHVQIRCNFGNKETLNASNTDVSFVQSDFDGNGSFIGTNKNGLLQRVCGITNQEAINMGKEMMASSTFPSLFDVELKK